MSELRSKCCGAKVTRKEIMIPIGGSYSLREAYYCNKCNRVCATDAEEKKDKDCPDV